MTLSVLGTQIAAAIVGLTALIVALTALVNQIQSALQDVQVQLDKNTSKLAEVHVMVNSNLTTALSEVARMHAVIESRAAESPSTPVVPPVS